jgi:hypothetical protein
MAAPIEVIVKFKEDRIVKEIVDSFWVEPEQARRCFERFKQGRAEFKEARLVRVTYSGELVLAFPLPAAAAERRAASQDLLARLNGIADVAYAEPDHTASVQGP